MISGRISPLVQLAHRIDAAAEQANACEVFEARIANVQKKPAFAAFFAGGAINADEIFNLHRFYLY
jgi:hypothetical protein